MPNERKTGYILGYIFQAKIRASPSPPDFFAMLLTEKTIKHAKPTERSRKLFDGGGLYLLITPQGCKYWRYRYRFAGKDSTLALGVYGEVSLKQARQLHREAKSLLHKGIDPLARQQEQRQGNAGQAAFERIAREWYAYQRPAWKNAKHAQQVIHTLEQYAFPHIGDMTLSVAMLRMGYGCRAVPHGSVRWVPAS